MNILNKGDLFPITVRPVYKNTRGNLKMRLLSAFAVDIVAFSPLKPNLLREILEG
jgi:hypothetical protein